MSNILRSIVLGEELAQELSDFVDVDVEDGAFEAESQRLCCVLPGQFVIKPSEQMIPPLSWKSCLP